MRDQLGLRALVAALEELDGHASRGPEAVFEERALEVVQRRLLVVGGGRRELDRLGGDRAEPLERRGTTAQCNAAGLARERDRNRRADATGERFDRVKLERVEVIEAVAEDRRGSPAVGGEGDRVERGAGVQLAVGMAESLEA